jgi:hypothetical protein
MLYFVVHELVVQSGGRTKIIPIQDISNEFGPLNPFILSFNLSATTYNSDKAGGNFGLADYLLKAYTTYTSIEFYKPSFGKEGAKKRLGFVELDNQSQYVNQIAKSHLLWKSYKPDVNYTNLELGNIVDATAILEGDEFNNVTKEKPLLEGKQGILDVSVETIESKPTGKKIIEPVTADEEDTDWDV